MTAAWVAASGSETRKKIDHVPLSLKESRRLNPEKIRSGRATAYSFQGGFVASGLFAA
jgi:hypothetical protein